MKVVYDFILIVLKEAFCLLVFAARPPLEVVHQGG